MVKNIAIPNHFGIYKLSTHENNWKNDCNFFAIIVIASLHFFILLNYK